MLRAGVAARNAIRRHPRTLTAGIAAGLVGFAATAFGIAPRAPDAADLPQRLVTEAAQPADVGMQLEALAGHGLELYRSEVTRPSDTVDGLLRRLGVIDAQAAAFLKSDATARALISGRPGKQVRALARDDGALVQLVARYPAESADQAASHFRRLTIERQADGPWQARVETVELDAQVRLASGTIQSSLFAATDDARIPDGIASQLAEMFSTDIDFHRELRRGDTFSLVYETLTADGEPVPWGSGRVLAAEFVNGTRTHQAMWYEGSDGRGAYFGFDGESKRRSFLASPLEFSRVTSGFAMRMHPILQRMRAHKGIDYAAPTGTAVRVVGDGVVDFAGWQTGYGNVVRVQHARERSTVYAHLSRIDVKVGQHVTQSQTLGAVGMTGWATGPHLHFEFIVDGEQRNPLEMAKASEAFVVGPAQRADFKAHADAVLAQLQAAQTIDGAAGEHD